MGGGNEMLEGARMNPWNSYTYISSIDIGLICSKWKARDILSFHKGEGTCKI